MITKTFKNFGFFACLLFLISIVSSFQKDRLEPTVSVTQVSTNKKYGMKPGTAIEVGTVSNEYKYLDQLCGPNGEKIKYKRISSCCEFKCSECPMGVGLLDQWEIQYRGLKKPIIIYLNGYRYDDPKAPKALGIKSQR